MLGSEREASAERRIAVDGQSFAIHEWRGSGPAYMHVHHADDEAWHVLEGALRVRFTDRELEVGAGSTVFVPAGTAHTYEALPGTRYLTIMSPRLRQMIAELQTTPDLAQHREIMARYDS